MNKKLNWVWMLPLLFITLLLTSCGGSSGNNSGTGSGNTPTATPLTWDQGNWDETKWQ